MIDQEAREFAKVVGFDFEYGARDVPEGWPEGTRPYAVTLTFGRTRDTWAYYMGPALTDNPTVEDVLGSLFLDARCGTETFEEYCAETGADEDSRHDYATWEACADTARRLRFMFGDKYADYAEIEWDS